jgi:hypothetical protein
MTILTKSPPATFIHIPKTGGNSVRTWLLDNVPKSRAMFQHSFMKDHAPYSYIKKAIKDDRGLVFAVVRNPWSRVVSAYHYHKQRDRQGNYVTFDQFVELDMRAASRPQHLYVDQSVTILKLEQIEQDFKQIQDYFKCYIDLPVLNKSKHTHYSNYYNDHTKQIVADKFKRDIELYKYQYEQLI